MFPVHMACGTPWGPKLDPPLQTPLSGSFLSIGSESTSYSPIAKVFVLFLSCPLILELGFTLQRLFHIYSDFFHNIPVSFYNLFFIMLLFCPPPSFYFIFFSAPGDFQGLSLWDGDWASAPVVGAPWIC